MSPILYFWIFLKASLFSTGGTGNLPSLHADLIPRHIATDRQFAEALLVGQISPGPNGLWAVSLGYLTHGALGAILATIALSLPPLTVLWVYHAYEKVRSHPAVEGLMRGLGLAVSGTFVVVLPSLLSGTGPILKSLLFMAVAVILGLKRVPVVVIIAVATVAGIALRGWG
jgi:chromate transporter